MVGTVRGTGDTAESKTHTVPALGSISVFTHHAMELIDVFEATVRASVQKGSYVPRQCSPEKAQSLRHLAPRYKIIFICL